MSFADCMILLAIIGLALAILGVVVSFSADDDDLPAPDIRTRRGQTEAPGKYRDLEDLH